MVDRLGTCSYLKDEGKFLLCLFNIASRLAELSVYFMFENSGDLW